MELRLDRVQMSMNEDRRPDANEISRMERLKALSSRIWDSTSWLLKLLGASAFFAIGLQFAAPQGRVIISTPAILSVIVVVLGAAAYGLITTMTESRIDAAQMKSPSKPLAYSILVLALVTQIGALGLAPALQGVAVYQSLGAADPRVATATTLAARLDLYATTPLAIDLVRSYCRKHIADDALTTRFLRDCLAFTQTPAPTQAAATSMAAALRSTP